LLNLPKKEPVKSSLDQINPHTDLARFLRKHANLLNIIHKIERGNGLTRFKTVGYRK
jgi:hypothetical protein